MCVCQQPCHPKNVKKSSSVIPGWSEFGKPKKDVAQFWYSLWRDSGSPRGGELANVMRYTKRQYHYAIRSCRKNVDAIRANRMAEALSGNKHRAFWQEVKRFKQSRNKQPTFVDGVTDAKGISTVFYHKFKNLYTSVGYDQCQLERIRAEIATRVSSGLKDILDTNKEIVSTSDICSAIGKLKNNKSDGGNNISTDCLLNATPELHKLLAILFKCILVHGYMPAETLLGHMTPIPKCKTVTRFSDKYRAITLSSVIGKVFDLIILDRERKKSLATSDLQFSYKPSCSTTLCTAMLRETITHFNNSGSSVYGLFLDATKAFDRVDFAKLFDTLCSRNMNPIHMRCLLHMYSHQSLCVRWNGITSDTFLATNGVKQGGILSPLLFTAYVDGLVEKLQASGEGCYIGPYFASFYGYADDVCILAPNLKGLQTLADICVEYAHEHKILFNGSKSQLIKFQTGQLQQYSDDEKVLVCGNEVQCKNNVTHLGHTLYSNILKDDTENIIKQMYRQFNSLRTRFNTALSQVRSELFTRNCTSFYGIQMCDLGKTQRLHTSYRKCLRCIWGIFTQSFSQCNFATIDR